MNEPEHSDVKIQYITAVVVLLPQKVPTTFSRANATAQKAREFISRALVLRHVKDRG
jgi:hypothetical protein